MLICIDFSPTMSRVDTLQTIKLLMGVSLHQLDLCEGINCTGWGQLHVISKRVSLDKRQENKMRLFVIFLIVGSFVEISKCTYSQLYVK